MTALLREAALFTLLIPGYEGNSPVAASDFDHYIGYRLTETVLLGRFYHRQIVRVGGRRLAVGGWRS